MSVDTDSLSVSDALLHSIKTGTQPDPEAIASGDLGSATLQSLVRQLQTAQEDVNEDIRQISKQSASDVGRWITEAKQLRTDVRESEEHARNIKAVVVEGTKLRDVARDAQNKVAFLRNELEFQQALSTSLGKIQSLKVSIEEAREATIQHKLKEAVQLLQKSQLTLSRIPECRQTGLLSLLQARIAEIYHGLSTLTVTYWDKIILWDKENCKLRMREVAAGFAPHHDTSGTFNDPKSFVHADDIIFVLEAIGALHGKLLHMKNEVLNVFFRPRLRGKRSIRIAGPCIIYDQTPPDSSIEVLISDISAMLNFFDLITRDGMTSQLMEILAPEVIAELIQGPLHESVPPDLSGIPRLSDNLAVVKHFSQAVKARKWPGYDELERWVSDAPKTWLQRRSDGTLDSVRYVLGRGLGRARAVEKVETQTVSSNDEVFNDPNGQDDWDASWSDDDAEAGPKAATAQSRSNTKIPDPGNEETGDEEEADEAWGFDDDEDGTNDTAQDSPRELKENAQKTETQKEEADEDGDEGEADDAWGWGDDNTETDQPQSTKNSAEKNRASRTNASTGNKKPTERQLTLRETYYVSSIPEQILEMVVQIVDDAQSLLNKNEPASNPIQPAGEGLLALPCDVLAIFRACAPTAYESDAAGSFYMYNDSQYLAQQLRAFSEHYAQRDSSNLHPLTLDSDITALDAFGKRAYGREMEAQRTILRDLLDGAQGFSQCTEDPFAEQCELAVASVVDRLHSLHAQWHDVAAPSALHQSLGSLYGTIIAKVVLDICDLSDISEPESRRLVQLCSKLEDPQLLFLADRDDEETEISEEVRAQAAMAASVYTPALLRFQWLAQILEGSLADIKFWWNESELSLAFEAAEVVDLIEALFADSDHRRKAIADVRRGR